MAPEISPQCIERFEREVLPHVDVAYRMAMTLTRDADRADDLVQDASLRALRSFPKLKHKDNLRSWFVRVVHTTFLDTVRYERRRPTESIDDENGNLTEADLGVTEMEPKMCLASLDDDYEAVMDSLPTGWRAVVQMVDVEGMSYEECAETLDLPVGTVRSRLHRARSRLHQGLCQRLQLRWCEEQEKEKAEDAL